MWLAGGGGLGLNRLFYVATTLALSFAVVHTRQMQTYNDKDMHKLAKRPSKTKKKKNKHQDIHSKTYNDSNSKQQQKHRFRTVSKKRSLGGYVVTTLALSSAVVYTMSVCLSVIRQFSPREGFLNHQCNISDNIKIK